MSMISTLDSIIGVWDSLYTFIFYSWPFLFLAVMFFFKWKWKGYPLDAVIIEKRGDNLVKTNDRIGKTFDPLTNMVSYKLLKAKDTIPVVNYEHVLHNKVLPTNFLEKIINLIRPNEGTIFLFRYGSKQYKPIRISENGKNGKPKLIPIKDDKGNFVFQYQYSQFDPRWVLGTLNFDVIDWDNMNFMVQEQRATMERRKKKSDRLLQYLIPITIIAASVVVAIFILKFSLDAGMSIQGRASSNDGNEGSKLFNSIGETLPLPGSD